MTVSHGEQPADAGWPPVTAHNSTPNRTIFVEQDNEDAWIATDLTVSLDP